MGEKQKKTPMNPTTTQTHARTHKHKSIQVLMMNSFFLWRFFLQPFIESRIEGLWIYCLTVKASIL